MSGMDYNKPCVFLRWTRAGQQSTAATETALNYCETQRKDRFLEEEKTNKGKIIELTIMLYF